MKKMGMATKSTAAPKTMAAPMPAKSGATTGQAAMAMGGKGMPKKKAKKP